jgi:hypothetical protein
MKFIVIAMAALHPVPVSMTPVQTKRGRLWAFRSTTAHSKREWWELAVMDDFSITAFSDNTHGLGNQLSITIDADRLVR